MKFWKVKRSLLEVKLLVTYVSFFYGETRNLFFPGDRSINNTKRLQKHTERGPWDSSTLGWPVGAGRTNYPCSRAIWSERKAQVVAVCSDGLWLIEYTDRSKHVKISWTISGQIGKDPCAVQVFFSVHQVPDFFPIPKWVRVVIQALVSDDYQVTFLSIKACCDWIFILWGGSKLTSATSRVPKNWQLSTGCILLPSFQGKFCTDVQIAPIKLIVTATDNKAWLIFFVLGPAVALMAQSGKRWTSKRHGPGDFSTVASIWPRPGR